MGRRYKKLSITLDVLMETLKGDSIRVKILNPLPEDVRVADVEIDCRYTSTGFYYVLHVIMESDEFEELAGGAEIPIYDMKFEQLPEPEYPRVTLDDKDYSVVIPDSSPFITIE